MLTPVDIENKTFERSFRGYSYDEVDNFIDLVIKDYETLYTENSELKAEITQLKNSLSEYKTMKETLQNSIIIAQSASDDVKKNAEEHANTVVKKAELKAANVIKGANDEVSKLKSSYDSLKMEVESYKSSIRGMCNGLIEMLDKIK
ncbi:MAG: DivIVA domain-containing protein [Oscillospiraceae bacterium]|nr:DivIVA domain-containing protein [Oscillospiraceae bacterium]